MKKEEKNYLVIMNFDAFYAHEIEHKIEACQKVNFPLSVLVFPNTYIVKTELEDWEIAEAFDHYINGEQTMSFRYRFNYIITELNKMPYSDISEEDTTRAIDYLFENK